MEFFFGIFPIFFFIVFALVLGMIVTTFVRTIKRENKNNHSPPADGAGFRRGEAYQCFRASPRRGHHASSQLHHLLCDLSGQQW